MGKKHLSLFVHNRVIQNLSMTFFFCGTQKIFGEMAVVLCQYSGSQWDPMLFGYQRNAKYIPLCSGEESKSYRFEVTCG